MSVLLQAEADRPVLFQSRGTEPWEGLEVRPGESQEVHIEGAVIGDATPVGRPALEVRPDEVVFERLFERTGGEREVSVFDILTETGWLHG